MSKYQQATTFSLHSVDHDEVLLDHAVHSTRNLLGEQEEMITPEKLTLSFTHNGESYETSFLRESGAIGEGVTMTLGGDNGEETVMAVPKTYAYYSEDRNWVLTFHNHRKFDGIIVDDKSKKVIHFVAEDGKLHLNDQANKLASGNFAIDFEKAGEHGRKLEADGSVKAIDYWADCHPGQSQGLTTLEMGVAAGYGLFQKYGQTESINQMNSFITLSNTIFERQMDISLQIQDIFVASTTGAASWTNPGCGNSIQTQLSQFRFWSRPSRQALWHLIDDCFGFSGGVIGIAYVGTICVFDDINVGVSYISEDRGLLPDYPSWSTVAHEIGHNFNAQHSFEEGQGNTGGIMDYGPLQDRLIDGEVQFNTQYRRREVCQEITANINCPDIITGSGPAPVASPTPPVVSPTTPAPTPFPGAAPTSCPFWFGCGADAEKSLGVDSVGRVLECAQHRNALVRGSGDLFEAMSSYTLGQCRSRCAAAESCQTFTFSQKTGYCELWTRKTVTDLVHASMYDTYICSDNGSLGEEDFHESVDDILGESSTSELKEACCTVMEGQTYQKMNTMYLRDRSREVCEALCVADSACSAVTFNSRTGGCMFYGSNPAEFGTTAAADSTTLTCNRECIVSEVMPATAGVNVVAVVAGTVVAVLAVVMALVAIKRKKTTVEDTA